MLYIFSLLQITCLVFEGFESNNNRYLQVIQLVALHVVYVALGFHASHLQALWTSNGVSEMQSGQPGAVGEDQTSELEALLAAPLVGLGRASESAGEEDLRMGSGAAWEADDEWVPPVGTVCPLKKFLWTHT